MKKYRTMLLIGVDIMLYIAVYVVGCILTSAAHPERTLTPATYIVNGVVFLLFPMLFRFALRVYSNVWRYANSAAYLKMLISDCVGGVIAVVGCCLADSYEGSLLLNSLVVAMFSLCTLATRFCYQQFYRHLNVSMADINKIGVAIVGAGQVGSLLAEELLYNSASHYRPICFVDRDAAKAGGRVCGLKVYPEGEGLIAQLSTLPIQEIFLALPSIDSETAEELYNYYSQTGCKVKLYDYPVRSMAGDAGGRRVLRELKIDDLLFRRSLDINDAASMEFYRDKVILVTGGGGSIGSELCRQIARWSPRRLIIFDIYENNAYEIQQELLRTYGKNLDLCVEIGSVRDRARLEAVFAHHRPNVVFHAAAHKHVPLMETSGGEAIKNNVFGTYNTADMAEKYGAEKFILISTDKAVNPTNVMGASKRMCEMIVQCRADSRTTFAAVRFGNVLGSNGSVIPLFRKQIEAGGPVTITDKRIIRYFMTIPEASQLVMQAGAMAKRGELFVLDMGKPVRILELAENMIRLSGLRPYEDIDIKEIGLREGEKLYEELLIRTETLAKTDNNLIYIEHDTPLSRREVDERLAILRDAVKASEESVAPTLIKQAMRAVVPTYRDPEEVNSNAADAMEMKEAEMPATV